MVILFNGCTKKSRSKIALLLRFSFFLNFLLFGWEKNRQKKSTRCNFTKFGGWKDLIFLEIVAKNGVKIRPLEHFPLVCLLTEKDVYPWHFGNGSAAYYRGEGCRAAETRVAQRLAGRNASKMHDALPSPRHTSKPVVVVVCRRGPPPRVQGRARASGCRTPRSPKDQEGKHVHARPICAPPSEHGVVELCLVHPRRARLTSMVDARRCPTRCWFCCAGCLILDGAAVRLSPEAPHASGCPLNVLRRFPRTLPSGVGSALPYASACRHAPRRAGGCSSGRAGFADRGGG